MRSERGLTMLEVIVIIVIAAMFIVFMLPPLHVNRESARRTSCASNLNQLAKAMFMYSDVPSNAVFPCASDDPDSADPMASLGLLFNKYIADPKVFSCPQNPLSKSDFASMVPGRPVLSSYGYDPHHGADDPIAAIASDSKGTKENSDNHGFNVGQNVMIGSGTIEFMETASRHLTKQDGTLWTESSIFVRDPALPRNEDGFIRQK